MKCGEINGVPIRWNKLNIKSGKQKLGTTTVTFQKCLLQKSVIKMDIVALINSVFTDFSENYYFQLGRFTNYEKNKSKQKIQTSLLNDAKQYFQTGKLFKALKRLFSFFISKHIQSHLQEILIQFFNSEIGFLNKSKNELEILILILENNRKPNRKDIIKNLQTIKQNLIYITEIQMKDSMSETLDLICKRRNLKEIKEGIEVLKSYLQKKINEATMPFLERHISLFNYIK